MIIAFIDQMRSEGAAVESICRVLREQGCQIAARTYRAWRSRRPAVRTITDAQTVDAVRDVAWLAYRSPRPVSNDPGRALRAGEDARPLGSHRDARCALRGGGSCDEELGLKGIRRSKGIRTTIPSADGIRAGDLLNRQFRADEPNRVWVTDFKCRRRH
jgi:putative transposase